ncbi:phosphopyruvate hydratase [Candidatus Berkelbacteria bacterium CG08_land_8_20_14_0_20_39_8]|uniref:Enolase n=1 Tax=Candidatus Berkelbacteria bacterium CG08_land_8_20_14_0_20_39_8 TaxID=1974511 RepID=A0A2M6YC72_9BACT|nr:MAG: phosphopyruvate hydratase [Candidatus Berkelbacteria bacterium CG08_land_8_20_14_0_20_39_8]
MAKISKIIPLEVLDSRGNPTVFAKTFLEDGTCGVGYVPSGASTGKYEALELHDKDPKRFNGKGVLAAIKNIVEIIAPAIVGVEIDDFRQVDEKMIQLDGTPNKSKLGANAILAVSISVADALAKSKKLNMFEYLATYFAPSNQYLLPLPYFNILNGGKHAIGSTDFQEFMIVPVKFPTFSESYRAGTEIYHALGKILLERNYQPLVGDEGGFAPSLFSNEQAMELLMMAIKDAGYAAGEEVFIALDPAASRFFYQDVYQLHRENRTFTGDELVDFYKTWVEKYPIISIEDGLSEDDWQGWQRLTAEFGSNLEIIGDDLYTTNIERIKIGIAKRASNSILIKPNQIGTLTETIQAINFAKQNNMKFMISHRSGENEDTFIADLAVAAGGGMIKSGAPCRSERTSKYNRLKEIEMILGDQAKLATRDVSQNTGLQ